MAEERCAGNTCQDVAVTLYCLPRKVLAAIVSRAGPIYPTSLRARVLVGRQGYMQGYTGTGFMRWQPSPARNLADKVTKTSVTSVGYQGIQSIGIQLGTHADRGKTGKDVTGIRGIGTSPRYCVTD